MELNDILEDFHFFETDPRNKAHDRIVTQDKNKIKVSAPVTVENKPYNMKYSKKFYNGLYSYPIDKAKELQKRIKSIEAVLLLKKGGSLPSSYRFHYFDDSKLTGDFHLGGDIVVPFNYDDNTNTFTLEDIGSHSATGIFN